MFAFLGLLVGATVTLLANVALQRWKYGREAIDKRCDEVEKAVFELGAACRDYWLRPWPHPRDASQIGPTSDDLEFVALHSRIVGLTQRIQGLNAIILNDFEADDQKAVLENLSVALDQATGGNFEVKHRKRDFDRARGVEAACADYTVSLRLVATRRWQWSAMFAKTERSARGYWLRYEDQLTRHAGALVELLIRVRS